MIMSIIQAIRLAMPAAAMATLFAIGARTPAIAAPPSACNVPDIVARALPAIVNITVVKVLSKSDGVENMALDADSKAMGTSGISGADNSDPPGPHFETFVGSGAIISPAGIIVTNKHVIKDAAVIEVTFSNKTQVPAQLIAAASLMDLALLKVNVPEPLPTLQFGDSDALRIGQTVIAVGDPLGLGTSVSVGVVSARGRDVMRTPFDDFIQTDATINPGNSGGPLLNCAGRIARIDTALLSNSRVLGSIGIGFALPSNDTQFVVDKLMNPATARPNWIGLQLQNMTARLATIFGRPDMSGAIVTGVAPNSPAASAEIQPGDIIAGVDGQEMDNASAILRYVVRQPSDQPISLLVWRRDQMEEVVLLGQPWPHMRALRGKVLASAAEVAQAQAGGLGLHLAMPSSANHQRHGIPETSGVLVDRVTPGPQAAAMGLQPGDIVERVGDRPAVSPAEVMHELVHGSAADGDIVALLVHGKTGTQWITLYVGRVYVAGLVATPLLSGGFGPADEAPAGAPSGPFRTPEQRRHHGFEASIDEQVTTPSSTPHRGQCPRDAMVQCLTTGNVERPYDGGKVVALGSGLFGDLRVCHDLAAGQPQQTRVQVNLYDGWVFGSAAIACRECADLGLQQIAGSYRVRIDPDVGDPSVGFERLYQQVLQQHGHTIRPCSISEIIEPGDTAGQRDAIRVEVLRCGWHTDRQAALRDRRVRRIEVRWAQPVPSVPPANRTTRCTLPAAADRRRR